MALVPYTFANQSGQIPLSELDANFANVKAFAETAGNVTGNTQANITALGTLTSLTVSGNVVAPTFVGNLVGNISGNLAVPGGNTQVLFNDNNVANATSGMTFNKSNNAFLVAGNVTGGNLQTTGLIVANGITMGANTISATGNITANLVLANSGIIGVPLGVLTLFLGNNIPTTVWIGGNAANIYLANVNSTTYVSGNLSAGGNVFTSGLISAAGNIIGGNIIGTIVGTVSTPSVSASGNITGGNIITGGTVTATGNILGGNLVLTPGSGNAYVYDLSATGSVFVTGVVSAAGNVQGGNLNVAGTSTLTGVATAPTAANGTSNTQVATTEFVQNSLLNLVPSGVIVMWSGSIASVPSGWFLCNGANGTPDLRNRFIVGAGSTYAVNATGGSADATVVAHTHTASSVVSDPGHTHTYTAPVSGTGDSTGVDTEVVSVTSTSTGNSTTGITVSTTVNSTGSSGTNANLPPYYALAYIMKA